MPDYLCLSISIARFQAYQRPMPSRSLLSSSAQWSLDSHEVASKPDQVRYRSESLEQRVSWTGTSGGMRATCPKRASLLRFGKFLHKCCLSDASRKQAYKTTCRSHCKSRTLYAKVQLVAPSAKFWYCSKVFSTAARIKETFCINFFKIWS